MFVMFYALFYWLSCSITDLHALSGKDNLPGYLGEGDENEIAKGKVGCSRAE